MKRWHRLIATTLYLLVVNTGCEFRDAVVDGVSVGIADAVATVVETVLLTPFGL